MSLSSQCCQLEAGVGHHEVAAGEYVLRVEVLLHGVQQADAGRRYRPLQKLLSDLANYTRTQTELGQVGVVCVRVGHSLQEPGDEREKFICHCQVYNTTKD